jgi:hypothetical protein
MSLLNKCGMTFSMQCPPWQMSLFMSIRANVIAATPPISPHTIPQHEYHYSEN